jgi:P-type Na+/K+ transporter
MILVLIIAMIVSFAIKSWIEAGVIAAVIGLNILIGFIQEFKAGKTMDSLRSLSSPTANVIRDGDAKVIPTAEMVPGDMVELKTGDTVPADLRLLESINFETDEALLTGESLPVLKDEEATFPEDTGPGDRLNIAYSSSTVTKGRARGIAYATAMKTEIGAIAAALRKGDSKVRPVKRRDDGSAHPFRYAQSWSLTATDAIGRFLGVNVGTPLQKKLSRLAMLLFGIAIVCAIIVMAANYFSNNPEVIIYAVATGISMLPASLIVVLTIAMAVGTRRMVERNVIVSLAPRITLSSTLTCARYGNSTLWRLLAGSPIFAPTRLVRSRKARWWLKSVGSLLKEHTQLDNLNNPTIPPWATFSILLLRQELLTRRKKTTVIHKAMKNC